MIRPTCEDTFLVKRRDLNNNYHSMILGPYSRTAECRPGSFVHLKLPGAEIYFRRAMSVAGIDVKRRQIEIIFKVAGRGTSALAQFVVGDRLDVLGPLGVPFTLPKKTERAIMVAGGVGFPPLFFLASHMIARGHDPKRIEFFYGGRTDIDLLERTRIRKLGVNFHPATDDGSFGEKALITSPVARFIQENPKEKMRIYACGPDAMLRATDRLGLELGVPGQLSLEAPMPCGIGVCLGCVVPLKAGGYSRVCCDGPVYEIGEVQFDC